MSHIELSPLWTRARAMFARATAAFGAPDALAAGVLLSRHWRREVGAWLALIEHVVRKLLFAEAARLSDDETTGSLQARSAAPAAKGGPRRPRAIARVAFALALPRDPRAVPEAHAPRVRSFDTPPPAECAPAAPQRRAPDLRIARRLEALRRALEHPLAQARRLKRLLARAVRRFPEIMVRFALSAPRAFSRDVHDPSLPQDAAIAAFAVLPASNTS